MLVRQRVVNVFVLASARHKAGDACLPRDVGLADPVLLSDPIAEPIVAPASNLGLADQAAAVAAPGPRAQS